jgi:hypothetical protein
MRSKIRVYWTTNPADMGYDGRPTLGEKGAWKGPKARYELCSVRKAVGFRASLDRLIGQGVYRMVSLQHDGEEIALSDLQELVAIADIPTQYR